MRRREHDDVADVAGPPNGVIQPYWEQTQPTRHTLTLIRHHRARVLGRSLELDAGALRQARRTETARSERS
jgi:hypothetical protein